MLNTELKVVCRTKQIYLQTTKHHYRLQKTSEYTSYILKSFCDGGLWHHNSDPIIFILDIHHLILHRI